MQHESTTGKFIVFKSGDYFLALPINEVLKVVNYAAVENRELRTMGVVQLGKHTIKLLDWHRSQLSSGDLADSQPFLVITRGVHGELCGIPVNEPPNLMELPLELMRNLPTSNSQSGVLEWVSHAAVLSQDGVTTTIFLLDLKRVSNTAVQESYPPALRSSYTKLRSER